MAGACDPFSRTSTQCRLSTCMLQLSLSPMSRRSTSRRSTYCIIRGLLACTIMLHCYVGIVAVHDSRSTRDCPHKTSSALALALSAVPWSWDPRPRCRLMRSVKEK